jgi:hypothetical protein
MALKKTIVEPSWEAKYSFSPAVITEGGKTVWLAGHVGFVDDSELRSPGTSTLRLAKPSRISRKPSSEPAARSRT